MFHRSISKILAVSLVLFGCATSPKEHHAKPEPLLDGLSAEDFIKADRLLAGGKILAALRNDDIDFHWLGQGEALWYRLQVPGGQHYVELDIASGHRKPLFDHEKMARALSSVLEETPEPDNLPITLHRRLPSQKYLLSLVSVDAVVNASAQSDHWWMCDLVNVVCLPHKNDAVEALSVCA